MHVNINVNMNKIISINMYAYIHKPQYLCLHMSSSPPVSYLYLHMCLDAYQCVYICTKRICLLAIVRKGGHCSSSFAAVGLPYISEQAVWFTVYEFKVSGFRVWELRFIL